MNTAPIDLFESDTHWRILMDLPQVAHDELELTVHEGRLTLSTTGEVNVERAFRLPRGVDDEAVRASLDKGVLTVDIEKPEAARPKRIAVA